MRAPFSIPAQPFLATATWRPPRALDISPRNLVGISKRTSQAARRARGRHELECGTPPAPGFHAPERRSTGGFFVAAGQAFSLMTPTTKCGLQ